MSIESSDKAGAAVNSPTHVVARLQVTISRRKENQNNATSPQGSKSLKQSSATIAYTGYSKSEFWKNSKPLKPLGISGTMRALVKITPLEHSNVA